MRFTPATNRIRQPNRSPSRSTRPPPRPSTAPITAPLCSTWKRKAIAAAGFSNPTSSALEKRITELEGGVGALTAASGRRRISSWSRSISTATLSSLFTVGIKGGMEAGKTFYDALKLITRLVNIGDAKSLAGHPASTTHRLMSSEPRLAGVLPETIRLSIGIEHSADRPNNEHSLPAATGEWFIAPNHVFARGE